MAQENSSKVEANVEIHQTTLEEGGTKERPLTPQHPINARIFRRYKLAYGLSQLVLGSAFGAFTSYVGFQIQVIGYTIGHVPEEPDGTGCPPDAVSCRVPFASHGDVNLTSFLIYLQAIVYAASGLLTLIVAGIGDRMSFQREQYVFLLALYGVFALPLAGLQGFDLYTFNTLSGLYVVFNIIGFIVLAWARIFIPFVMHRVEDDEHQNEEVSDLTASNNKRPELAGLSLSIWGSNAINLGQLILFVIVIGLTTTSSVYAGLYVTTASGALCFVGALLSWIWLPAPPRKPFATPPTLSTWLMTPFATAKELVVAIRRYPEAMKYLLAYTVYVDSTFAFDAIRFQLFNLVIRPTVRELTIYTLVGIVASIICGTGFVLLFPWIERRLKLSLRHWTVVGYMVAIGITVWASIGISDRAAIGLKSRWEFYVMAVVRSGSDAVLSIIFGVLYPQMFPRGSEIEYFGFQLVLSCSTVWIPQIVNGPLVDATNIIRLPAVISAVTLLVSVGLVLATNEVKGRLQARQG